MPTQQLWFGTKQNFQWVPMPSSGIQRRNVFSSESGTLDRGGAYVARSVGRHAEYDFSYGIREASGISGLNVFQEYATGVWDNYSVLTNGFNPDNLIYFCDPMTMRANVFPPHWSAPILATTGDYPLQGKLVSTSSIGNTYRTPSRRPTYNITHDVDTLPVENSRKLTIPIPPGYSLRWGWCGGLTGVGVVRQEAHEIATNTIVASNIAGLSSTGSTRMNTVVNGDTYDYVTIGLSRSSAATAGIQLTSMMGQIWPNNITPPMTGNHIYGLGNTGCLIDGDLTEDYIQADDLGGRRLKSLSFGLVEVGAWLP